MVYSSVDLEMSGDNQLFIGRLPRGSRSRELEDVFYKYGKMTRCDVKQGEAAILFFVMLSYPLSTPVHRHKDG